MLDALMKSRPEVEVEVQALQVGPTVFVTNPAEYFVQFGLDIKKGSKFPCTFPVELANDCTGYVPTERHRLEEDGNLSDWSWVAPGSEERLLTAVRRVLQAPDTEAAALPWKRNLPLALVKKELYVEHPASRVAPWVSLQYAGPHLELREVQGIEPESDVGEKIRAGAGQSTTVAPGPSFRPDGLDQ